MKNKQRHELAVCGFAAVQALGTYNPQKIKRLYYTADRARALGALCKYLAAHKIPYNQVQSADELKKLSASVHHQGVTAMIEQPSLLPLTKTELENWAHDKACALLLDGIGNADNVGALIRSAAFFGINRIVLSEQESRSFITTAAYRSAQGGMETVRIYGVRSLCTVLQDAQGKLLRLGSAPGGKYSVRNTAQLCRSQGKGALVVLGNEENGMSEETAKLCDYMLQIPGCGALDSLNVAQAASVILYEMSAIALN